MLNLAPCVRRAEPVELSIAASLGSADGEARLFRRLGLVVAVLVVELVGMSIWLDTNAMDGDGALTSLVARWGPGAVRFVVGFAVVLLIFGESAATTQFRQLSASVQGHRIAWWLLVVHLGLIVTFGQLSSILFASSGGTRLDNAFTACWMLTGVLSAGALTLTFLPVAFWAGLCRALRPTLSFALVVSLSAYAFGRLAESYWQPLSRATLQFAYVMLHPLAPAVRVDFSTFTIGAPGFWVDIGPTCSGYEGLGLILVFTAAWLWFHRADWRFPRALVLVPIGLAAIWFLNAVRIAGLVLIGVAGAPAIALGGFHSEAGWLAINAVALGSCVIARRIPWLMSTDVKSPSAGPGASNPTAVYLMPFLAVLAAAMVAHLGSSGFEWLYPVRVLTCATALWLVRGSWRSWRWKVEWTSLGLGALVFVIWIALEPVVGAHAGGMPVALSQAPGTWRTIWLAFRIIGAVLTVPLAEELAFRGFLLRRLVSDDFQSVRRQSVSWMAIVLSSMAFGVLHSERWLAGTIAGILYAIAWRRRGSLGDAFAAHAMTNALIVGWVLIGGHWQLW